MGEKRKMAERLLGDPFETLGEWFLPENPGRKIAGTLSYGPNGSELNLHQAFVPLRGAIGPGDSLQTYAIVMGTTREGDAMTILHAHRAGISFNFGSGGVLQPERLISSWLLVGAHIPQNFTYPEMSFRLPSLQIWLSRRVIHESHARDESNKKYIHSYTLEGIDKENFPVKGMEGSLEWYYQFSSSTDPFTSISVSVKGWIKVRPDKPKKIEWYLEQLGIITSMLTLITGTSMSPDCIKAGTGQKHQALTCLITFANRKCCEYKDPHDFFILRANMGVDLNNVINRWFAIYPKISQPSELAISVLSSETLWMHVEFLSFMQALEGFHRALFDGIYMNEKEYEKIKNLLCDAIPVNVSQGHKEALKSRIRYGNQISLRKRLDSLAGIFPEKIRKIILGPDGKVPRSWIDTRNYYTHWDEDLRDNILDTQGMYDANLRMSILLRILYLDLMGIPNESIIDDATAKREGSINSLNH